MKCAVIQKPGLIVIEDRDIPEIKDDEILVKVKVCGVDAPTDLHYMNGEDENTFPITGFNSYFGHEGTGIVEKIGSKITEFKIGDRIAYLGAGYQEYAIVKESLSVKLPDEIDFSEALAEPLAVVLNTIDHSDVQFGDDVVILGAGFMGLLITQGLANSGAGKIIVTDIDGAKLEIAKKLGATHVINAKETDVVEKIKEITNGKEINIVIEAAGSSVTLNQAGLIVGKEGKIILHGFHPKPVSIDMVPWHCNELTIINSHPSSEEKCKSLMARSVKLLQDGKFDLNKLITHKFKLEELNKVYEMLKTGKDFIKMVVMI
ncbi:MAG: zinc-binding dehydrogenase [Candidatus Firestonebacteria bacterium]